MGQYDVKQVIVVRKDLNMRKGKMCAQVAHASMKVLLDRMEDWENRGHEELIKKLIYKKDDYFDRWLNGAFAKVVVSCDSLDELIRLKDEASESGMPTARITDSGATEFKGVPTITCLAIGPYKSEEIDKITGHLKLL